MYIWRMTSLEGNLVKNVEYLTTGVVARYCGVTKVTVLRWIRKGHLKVFRLPGGHYRIASSHFNKFLRNNDIPVRRMKAGKTRHIKRGQYQ